MAENVEIPESHQDLLESTGLAVVATIGPDGAPQANPVWFLWDGSHLSFSQTSERQKYKNLKKDSRLAATIVDPANPGRYLELRGSVVGFVEDTDQSHVNALAKKYLGQDTFPWLQPGEVRVIVSVAPERALVWG